MSGPLLIKKHGVIVTKNSPLVSNQTESEYFASILLTPDEQKTITEQKCEKHEEAHKVSLEKKRLKKELAKAKKQAIHLISHPEFRRKLLKGKYPSESEIRSSHDAIVADALIELLQRRGEISN